MRIGDRVVCIKRGDWTKTNRPTEPKGPCYGDVLIIKSVKDRTHLVFEEYYDYYNMKLFRKIEPLDTKAIAEEFTEVIEISPVIEPEYA